MYFIMFGVGIVFVLLTLVFGELEGVPSLSFLKPTLIAALLVVTGGLGLLLEPRLSDPLGAWIVFALCFSIGLVVAATLQRFVITPLLKGQNTSTFNMQDTIGQSAEVIALIPQGGYGKIRYTISGSTVTSPAKSEDGDLLPIGTRVEIIYIQGSTYFVRNCNKEESHSSRRN